MLKAQEIQRKFIQHLGDGEYDNGTCALNEDDSGDTDVNTVELSDGEYLDATSEDGDSEGQHNTDNEAGESEDGDTDWSYNLSEGEILVAGYSDAESDGGSNEGEVLIVGSIESYKREFDETVAGDGYNNISEGEVCDHEILMKYAYEDCISDGGDS